jgi:hypothetical protein
MPLRGRTSYLVPAILLVSAALLALPAASTGTLAAGSQAPQGAPNPQSPFGIAGVMRWPDWGTFGRPADFMLQTNAGWVREDFAWGLIQPRPDAFDWTATDRIVGNLADRKINVLGILSYSASWATSTTADDTSAISFYPPDLDKYYAFVKTLVGRYKHAVHYWEVWNEPDNSLFWKPAPNAKEYATLLKTAYRAVKDADPSAQVLSGGVSGNAIPYLEEVLASGAGNSFDILALHPYAVPLNPAQARIESSPEVHKTLDVEMNKYRAFLQRHNIERPIWVTEIGWPAHDWGMDDEQQANYLAQTYALLLSSGIPERIFWYSFKDQSAAGRDSWGLIGWGNGAMDLGPARPALKAYTTSARLLTGASPAGRLQLAPFDNMQDFEQPATWTRSMNNQGSFVISSEQAHGGSSSGKLQYTFSGPSQAVDFAPPQPYALPGTPTRLGLWVRGDGSGNYLSAWLRDRDGGLFKVRLGAVTGASDSWRYFEAPIDGHYFDWEKARGEAGVGSSNAEPVYPVSFVSFRLENTPDEPAGSGTIYVDDLQSWDGPDVNSVRFTRTDRSVIDVLWSQAPANVSLPTSSDQVQVVSRDGTESSLPAKGGVLSLKVTSSPIYVIHKPPKSGVAATRLAGASGGPGPSGVPSSLCLAAQGASDNKQDGNRYFPETGHNLSGPFRTYWERNGGVNVLGFPITEEFDAPSSDGKIYRQQYFERARLEYHPANEPPADVQLGLLGVWAAGDHNVARTTQALSTSGGQFFPETGQALVTFKAWWNANGALPVFGFPISPELQERNAQDGKMYTVQYFERNRLEMHPEFAGTPREVMLGLLGVEYLAKQKCP